MSIVSAYDDEAFLAAFFDLSLPPAEFGHRGHVRLAWLLLRRHDDGEALQRLCDGIRAYATNLGAAAKFNRTVTEAILHLMAAGGARELGWEEFCRANAALLEDARGVLGQHYSAERIAAGSATADFLAPDLQPLPTK